MLVRAVHALHVKSVLHNDLHSGNILVKYNRCVKIIDFGKSTMIDDSIVCFVKPGTDKHKRYEKYHSHLAYELQNIPGSKVTVKKDIYSMDYIFSKISRQVKSNPLQILPVSTMSNNAGERPNLSHVIIKIKSFWKH